MGDTSPDDLDFEAEAVAAIHHGGQYQADHPGRMAAFQEAQAWALLQLARNLEHGVRDFSVNRPYRPGAGAY